jgi:hypothetical protein
VYQTLEMVRLHSPENYTLRNQNTADLKGDVMWTCFNLAQNHNVSDQVMSMFLVEVNTTWGQYEMCNFGVCDGLGGRQAPNVGRESFGGLNPNGGQCAENLNIGNWYSLNVEALALGQWKEITRVRTVSLDCMMQMGMREACDVSQWPFDKATAIAAAALEGACPDIPPKAK